MRRSQFTSRSRRRRASSSPMTCGRSTLSARRGPSPRRARWTTPMPPSPIFASRVYPPTVRGDPAAAGAVGVPRAGVRGVLVTIIRLDRGVQGSREGAGGARLRRVTESAVPRVRQLRLVVEATDFEAAAAFYRDALGLPVELDLEGDAGEHVLILDAGRATLELSNPQQVAMIDEVEVGRRVAPRLRVAFEVD